MSTSNHQKAVLITGAAGRIGAVIARFLHAQGMRVIVHYKASQTAAETLCAELNRARANSAACLYADLSKMTDLARLAEKALEIWGYLDVLVNNAAVFAPREIGNVDEAHWSQFMDINLKAPFFLAQLVAPALQKNHGAIINVVDIHGQKPMKNYPVYSITKAGVQMMTYALAKELAPDIRVNGVAPGVVLLPTEIENELSPALQADLKSRIALENFGKPEDIAQAVEYLIAAQYVTGQVLVVDGGRLLNC